MRWTAGRAFSTSATVFKGRAQPIVSPVRTSAAARAVRSGVMRLRVPRSSSAPQRPQLLQLSKSARKASASTVPGTVGRREYRRSTEVALRDPSNTAEGEPIGFVLGPRRFEHGITWARILGVASWRDLALGLRVDTPYVAFDLLMYGLTALLTTAMLNELGALRRERTVLMARASDVEILRRAERERGELLDRERSARAEAELATARLEALQQVADAALSRARLDDVLPEILERVAQLFDADFAVVLQRAQAQGTYALRASSTRGQVPRTVVLLQSGDAERAITSRRPIAIADHSTREIDTILGAQVREAALAPLYAGGDLVGLLYVMRRQGRAFSGDELGLLGLVGERVAAAVERGALLEAERRARAEAEAAEARMRLLLQAGDALGTESALERRLEDITRIAVPKLADLCAVDLLEKDGALRRVALAAVEVGMERDNWALSSRTRRDRTHAHPVWEVIDAVKPTLWDELDPERIGRLAWS